MDQMATLFGKSRSTINYELLQSGRNHIRRLSGEICERFIHELLSRTIRQN